MSNTPGVADTGYDIQFLRSADDGSTYADIGLNVVTMNIPERSRATYQKTHYRSPGEYHEYGVTMKDTGEFTIDLQFADPTAYAQLETDMEDGALLHWGWQFDPDAAAPEFTIAAFVIGVSEAVPMDDRMVATITFRPTGKPDWVNPTP